MKTSILGLGAVAATVVLWRMLATAFVVGLVLLKVFLAVAFVGFAIWFVRRVLRSDVRSESTTV